ncbi:MAG: TRAP transporter substrate-binding protein DctP [Gammaproteobacteria bacterium]|nr:TRAP transporter substrate-binding protein DctP [Gammaproteobacteria bacterium]
MARPSLKVLVTALALAACAPAAGEETLTLVSSWNRQINFSQHAQHYIDAVNERGRGVVQIEFIGGPEVIPQRQLFYALRRGVIDMALGGITYYLGLLPEGDAIFASNIDPMQARASGALEALQPYWKKRANAHLIGWMQSGIGISIYLARRPEFTPEGMPDLRGLKLRTSPSNRELLYAFGARPVQIALRETYTALQRGIVDGLAFTSVGLADLGVEEFVRYRIDPEVLNLSICLQINLDRWNALSEEARHILTDEATKYAVEANQWFRELRIREYAELAETGFQSVPAPDPEAFRDLAHQVVWERMQKRAPDSVETLKPLFYPQSDEGARSGGRPVLNEP